MEDGVMKVLDFGSANFDYVYRVEHLALPGETIDSESFNRFFGGKGLNQAIALARAGAAPFFAGMIGSDGESILELCDENGADRRYVSVEGAETGHAIIEVSRSGENSIILFGGANRRNSREKVDSVLAGFGAGDTVILQNEINLTEYIAERAFEKGMTIILNPSPYNALIDRIDLNRISVLILNEVEGEAMTKARDPEKMLDVFEKRYPDLDVVLTLGSSGSIYMKKGERIRCGAFPVDAVDTTAAGDTFTGYFVAGLVEGLEPESIMKRASLAASIAVSRPGAIPSIPTAAEVEKASRGYVFT